jgi:hypothetical protein
MKLLKMLTLLLIPFLGFSQQEGIWEVSEVKVGEKIMTPQSKWFEFKSDGSLYGGNGGVINTRGSYKMLGDSVYIMNEEGKDDGYGPFTLKESIDSSMMWSRNEDGMEVIILLERRYQIPMAPWDLLVGQWKVDTGDDRYSFRWDKFFVHTVDGKENWGIWHMHAHKPELRLMYFEEGKKDDLYIYKFQDEYVKLLKDGSRLITLKNDR